MKRSEIIENHLINIMKKNDKKDFPLHLDAQIALNELCDFFLGEDWYSTLSAICNEQINFEIVYEIENLFKGNKKIWKKYKREYKENKDDICY